MEGIQKQMERKGIKLEVEKEESQARGGYWLTLGAIAVATVGLTAFVIAKKRD